MGVWTCTRTMTPLGNGEEGRRHQAVLSLLPRLPGHLRAFSACGYQGLGVGGGCLMALGIDRAGAES